MPQLPPAPTAQHMDRLATVVAPLSRVVSPRLFGVERIPDRGAMLVGNHTLYGLIDVPFMMAELWKQRGIAARGIGEHAHYAFPVWRDLLTLSGMVRGTRENVRELMRQGEHILVFPGGSGEVFKDRDQRYQLIWKERVGFARLAIESGYPIVPFAAVGIEDALHVVADRTTPGLAQVSALMERLVGLHLPPIPVGIGPTPLPRPERLYFWFGDPIDTTRFDGDVGAAHVLRDEVRTEVESGIRVLRIERERDDGHRLAARIRRRRDQPSLADSDQPAWFVTRAFDTWNLHGAAGAAAWLSPKAELTDPPDWPGGRTHRGRDAVVVQLDAVAAALGGDEAVLTTAGSVGSGVLISMELRRADGAPVPDGAFHFAVTIEHGQITRMRAYLRQEQARLAAGRVRRSSV
ncbi:MAG: 1-acyl-sn-glycerol-3-phosphate acyltransferase [Baekduia sp.]